MDGRNLPRSKGRWCQQLITPAGILAHKLRRSVHTAKHSPHKKNCWPGRKLLQQHLSTISMLSSPSSPLYRPKNPLTMTIFVIPAPILALETFDWSDFPVVQRDDVSVHLLRNDSGNDSCSSHKDESTQKALHSKSHDHESLPELSSIGSDESDVSVTNTVSTSGEDDEVDAVAGVTTHSSTTTTTSSKRAVTFADHVHIRRHSLVIGDHPCCSQLALELSWEHDEGEWARLDEHREDGTGRRHTNTRRRPYLERKNLLKEIGGMTDEEIRETTLRHAAPSINDLSAMQGISL